MARILLVPIAFFVFSSLVHADSWPYNRVLGQVQKAGKFVPDKTSPEFVNDPENLFVNWLRKVVDNSPADSPLSSTFSYGNISSKATTIHDLLDELDLPRTNLNGTSPILPPSTVPSGLEASKLFAHLGYPLDPKCLVDKSRWWYRTYDGSCNWMKQGESSEGAVGTAKVRDYNQHYYADGISKPREGPNARAVSNAFFKRKEVLYYEHTPLLLGLIEFIMHDVTYSQDSKTEFIDVPMPDDEEEFYKNTTLRVWRTEAVPGTGTSTDNPRENINMATTWLDISSLYGSTPEVAAKLRSYKGGELLTQRIKTRGNQKKGEYLPYNTMNVPARTRPGVNPSQLFAGGDARTNEDWMMLGVHTLMVREHNRLCKILAKQHPEYDDERLYQTIRLVLAGKYALIANSYQMAYWTDKMPWPRDDGFPLYRQMYGENELQINPANTYPWPLVTKAGKPMVVSAEMAVVYRFHEFIIPSFPIKDAKNNTIWEQDLFGTGFNATGFVDAGLENVLRGMVGSTIPNFKSGVDDAFRNAGKYRGRPFDVATWSVIHEREQGLPTFNNYFIEYNKQDPHVVVPIRKTFEDFSSDPKMVANLKRLYKSPDHVDLVVGVQLEEEMFPGTTVPKSALIISLFSLFGMGNSDRFSVGFAMMRCLLVDKPWDCHPTNALEELIWAPKKVDGFPNFRFYDTFWLTEMDFQAHGTNLLWRLITENSEIKCVQHSPLFPADPVTNPVLCSLPKEKPDPKVLGVTVLEVAISLYKKHLTEVLGLAGTVISILLGFLAYKKETAPKTPPILSGLPIIGEALTFQKNPLKILTEGFQKYRKSPSKSFGIKLASMTHFVITDPRDLELMKEDNPYEVKFSLHLFLQAINFGLITKKVNFDSDLHTKLIRTHLSDPTTIAAFGPVIEEASKTFLERNPLVVKGQTTGQFNSLNDWCTQYITFVTSRCIVGPKGYDNDELLKTFMKFNDDAIKAMGLSSLLPSFLQFLAAKEINKDFEVVRRILTPVITARRNAGLRNSNNQPVFLDFIMEAVDDNQRVADLVAIVVWGGLVNLQANFTSTLLDILNEPGLQNTILSSLKSASPSNLNTFSSSNPQWKVLRSAMFESIRLSGPITGPARILLSSVPLASDPSLTLPKGKVATLSAYYTHRQPSNWGPTAASYDSSRFVQQDPPIGEPSFVTWGLKGPHSCPGRWFAQEAICLMVKGVLESYEFRIERVVAEEEKYVYTAGNVGRTVVGGMVVRR